MAIVSEPFRDIGLTLWDGNGKLPVGHMRGNDVVAVVATSRASWSGYDDPTFVIMVLTTSGDLGWTMHVNAFRRRARC